MAITKDMIISDILRNYPDAVGPLLAAGMHCIGCPASQGESLEAACAVHGLNPDIIVAKLNEVFGDK